MVRQILLLAAALAIVLTTFAVIAPPASAHQDGCLLFAHQGPNQLHLFCSTSANTCFMNGQSADTEAHLICLTPEPQPCVVKAKAADHQFVACSNHVGLTDD